MKLIVTIALNALLFALTLHAQSTAKFKVTNSVGTTAIVNVCATPGGAIIAEHDAGYIGIIMQGPVSAGTPATNWYWINAAPETGGWVAEDTLIVATSPIANPSTIPDTFGKWSTSFKQWLTDNPPVKDPEPTPTPVPTPIPTPTPAPSFAPAGYTLAFTEEFDGPLDVSPGLGWVGGHKWLAHTPYSGDFGSAYFTGPGEANTANPFSIDSGTLTITAWVDTRILHWRSGLLSSVDGTGAGFSQALGYWECRMKFPAGLGVWPSFWLNSKNTVPKNTRTTPSCEIDVVEAYGTNIKVLHQHVHIWSPTGASLPGGVSGTSTASVDVTADFHVYSVLIKSDFITFAFDGATVFQTPTPTEALMPMYCMVDLALGGGWPIVSTPNPSKLLVDYIKCWVPPISNP